MKKIYKPAEVLSGIENLMKEHTTALKPFAKPFFIALAIYSFSMLAIWRSGISFIDDMGRAINGTAWSHDFNRFSQSALSYILNVNTTLADISPLPQIVAMVFLAVTSVIITYLLCGRKIKYLPLVLSAFVGLLPVTIENWLYKFDSPGMAMSILVSVAPLLFWHTIFSGRKIRGGRGGVTFTIIATACLMVMWTSYQASSGVYPVMVLALILYDFLDRRKFGQIIKTALVFAVPYLISALVFRFVLPAPSGYREVTTLPASDLVPGIMRNLTAYMNFLRTSLDARWWILTAAVLVCFAAVLLIFSKRNKFYRLLDVAAGAVFVFLSLLISQGALLLLQHPPVNARSYMAVGLIVAVVGIITVRNLKIRSAFLAVPAVVLLYSCIVFSFAIGNALEDQHRWGTFRVETLLADLSRLYPDLKDDIRIQLRGDIGLSRIAVHVNRQYPITEQIITHQQRFGGHGFWAMARLRSYYGWEHYFEVLWNYEEWDYALWQIKLDTYYHIIRDSGDGRVHVVLR